MKSGSIVAFPKDAKRRTKDELEFLPAALEIVETPPSPIGRAIALTIIALFCSALAWASVGKIDIVASAPGKIVPTGRSKVVQPFETGVVRAIHVRDGQAVKAGDVLVELDSTMNQAESNHLQSDLVSAQLDIARLRSTLSEKNNPLDDFVVPSGVNSALAEMQRQLLLSQVGEQRAKLSVLDKQRAQKEAELATISATVEKLEASIPAIQERVNIRKTLADRELGSRLQYLEVYQLLVESQHEVLVQKSHRLEAQSAIAALIETRAQTDSEYRRTRSTELVEAERKVAGLSEDLIKADKRTTFQQLNAPVDGVVQQLSIHTVGGVVTPAQALLVIVPTDSHLEIEAMVPNRDIGFVEIGQDAAIKIDTFNFTRYGLIHGQILGLSQDAISRESPQEKNGERTPNSEAASSEPRGQELVYAARVSLDRTQMRVEDKILNLTPGMAVTVEIKTGSRRVISYLLSPIMRYGHDSLRER